MKLSACLTYFDQMYLEALNGVFPCAVDFYPLSNIHEHQACCLKGRLDLHRDHAGDVSIRYLGIVQLGLP